MGNAGVGVSESTRRWDPGAKGENQKMSAHGIITASICSWDHSDHLIMA